MGNDDSEDVEVQEAEQVDFMKVENHLAHGGSVFITSKSSQKIALPKDRKTHRKRNKTKRAKAFYYTHV